jgi:hypothetical protein
MQEAFARDAASTPETAATPPEAAKTPTPTQTAPTPGPIPLTVHQKALENARIKAAAEERATFDRDFGWARTVDRQALDNFSRLNQDPVAFVTELAKSLSTHPTYGPQMRSAAARTLATGRGQQSLEQFRNVVIDVGEGKQPIALFPLVQQAIEQAIQPLKAESTQRHQERQEQEAAQQAQASWKQLTAEVDDTLADLHDVLEIDDQTPAEQKQALYNQLHSLLASDPKLSPHKAAMRVRKSAVVPMLEERAKSRVLESLKNQAGAQQVNPAGPVSSTTKRVKSFYDKSLTW